MTYLGDINPSDVLDLKFTTCAASTGAPTTLSGTPAISVYKDNSTTQSTSGVTLSVDFDSVTGLNNVRVDTSADGTFYAAGSNFQVVITTGTVGGTSAVGYVVGQFSIQKRSALRPATAGRTLDVTAGGKAPATLASGDVSGNLPSDLQTIKTQTVTCGAGVTVLASVGTAATSTAQTGDAFARLGAPTGASISADIAGVQADTDDIQTRLPAALVGGRIDSSVGAMAANTLTASALAADAVTEIQSGLSTLTAGDVATELSDALRVNTIPELAQAQPSATPTFATAVMLPYMALRNELTTTATEKSLRNNAGTVICKKSLSDDGTTYTEAKAVTGP